MARALWEVISETEHGLCTWHIMKNGIKHLGNLMKDGPNFLSNFKKCMYDNEEETNVEASWRTLLLKYNVEENTWLNSTYQIKEKWAACYMKYAFTLGMRSTQLSESINSDIKSCTRPNLNIKQFERIVKEKRYSELKQDYEMRQKLPRMIIQSSPMIRKLSQEYTPPMFNLFQREWDLIAATNIYKKKMEANGEYVITMVDENGEWRVSYESQIENGELTITCSCRKFEKWGILCCHLLRILFRKDVKLLPNKYILKWLESSNRYKQLCAMLMRLADEASDYPEACSLVYQGVLELSKKVAEIRLNQSPHGPHDSTCEATRLKMKTTFHHQIGFSVVLQQRSQSKNKTTLEEPNGINASISCKTKFEPERFFSQLLLLETLQDLQFYCKALRS
ncbi:Protein FAR1-RELATED SEQUENCE 5 [Glycine soja]|uniref:Protein FAR1-RELATED SEQUENCE n=1 Tax=Glycine soja TaxID=3848 RepID=A0A445GT99_GLYSO|nr:Protein FAR1-RELATED SEQUENCE 5 [Glycine soja]